MKTFFAVFGLFLLAQAAQARGEEDIITADRMTCAQLLRQAITQGIYWKMSPDDGPIPIYGFKTYKSQGGTGGFCGKDKGPHPLIERTRDERYCRVGYVCF